jgi:hypothetical protein
MNARGKTWERKGGFSHGYRNLRRMSFLQARPIPSPMVIDK